MLFSARKVIEFKEFFIAALDTNNFYKIFTHKILPNGLRYPPMVGLGKAIEADNASGVDKSLKSGSVPSVGCECLLGRKQDSFSAMFLQCFSLDIPNVRLYNIVTIKNKEMIK